MKRFLGRRALLALGILALSLGATTSTARAGFTIEDLIDGTYTGTGNLGGGVTYAPAAGGHGILVGDKLFTGFGAVATGDMPGPGSINVIGIVDVGGNLGIRFQAFFSDQVGGGPSDVLITYHVHVTDPTLQITDAHLRGNPVVSGGTGIFNVTETFTGLPNTMQIFAVSPGATQSTDSTVFANPVTDLDVQKDIGAFAGTGVPNDSFIDQTFSQTRHVPEPASFALVALGMLSTGIVAYRRRKMAV